MNLKRGSIWENNLIQMWILASFYISALKLTNSNTAAELPCAVKNIEIVVFHWMLLHHINITLTATCRLNHQPIWHHPAAELDQNTKSQTRLSNYHTDWSDFRSMSCRQEVWQPRLAVDQLKDAELLEEKLPPAAGRPVDFLFLDVFLSSEDRVTRVVRLLQGSVVVTDHMLGN